MDEVDELAEAARSAVLRPRPAISPREQRRENRALWAVGFGIVSAAIGIFYMTRLRGPSGGGLASTVYIPPLHLIGIALLLALIDVVSGLTAVVLGLSAVLRENGRYSYAAITSIILGAIGWMGLILILFS